MKFMIIDDNPQFRGLLREIIVNPDDTAREYSSAENVVENYCQFHPDWVLMDIKIQPVNGFDATKILIKQQPEAKVIIISNHTDQLFINKSMDVGASAFVAKENLVSLLDIIHPARQEKNLNGVS